MGLASFVSLSPREAPTLAPAQCQADGEHGRRQAMMKAGVDRLTRNTGSWSHRNRISWKTWNTGGTGTELRTAAHSVEDETEDDWGRSNVGWIHSPSGGYRRTAPLHWVI